MTNTTTSTHKPIFEEIVNSIHLLWKFNGGLPKTHGVHVEELANDLEFIAFFSLQVQPSTGRWRGGVEF